MPPLDENKIRAPRCGLRPDCGLDSGAGAAWRWQHFSDPLTHPNGDKPLDPPRSCPVLSTATALMAAPVHGLGSGRRGPGPGVVGATTTSPRRGPDRVGVCV